VKSTLIQATSSSATATGCFTVIDHLALNLAADRRSSVALSDPLPSPPVSPLSSETTTNLVRRSPF
jgi:hypothetical protein